MLRAFDRPLQTGSHYPIPIVKGLELYVKYEQ
jgi:hypothetical protein